MTRRVFQSERALSFVCPGCTRTHIVQVGAGTSPRWDWNGDVDNVTVSPSLLCTWSEPSDDPEEFDDVTKDKHLVCHSFIRNGHIEFLADCTHALAGKTVQLPELEE